MVRWWASTRSGADSGAASVRPRSTRGQRGANLSRNSISRSRWRVAAAAPALAMVVAGVITGGASGGAQASAGTSPQPFSADDAYINYVAPNVEKAIASNKK